MSRLTELTLSAALDGLEQKAFSSREITEAFIAEIEASNKTLNAYVVTTPEQAAHDDRPPTTGARECRDASAPRQAANEEAAEEPGRAAVRL